MKGILEPMRDIIGRALYEEPPLDRGWYDLSEKRREPWRMDGDRVITAIRAMAPKFKEYALECGGADWLGIGPDELWTDFLDTILENEKPQELVADHTAGGEGLGKGTAGSAATSEGVA